MRADSLATNCHHFSPPLLHWKPRAAPYIMLPPALHYAYWQVRSSRFFVSKKIKQQQQRCWVRVADWGGQVRREARFPPTPYYQVFFFRQCPRSYPSVPPPCSSPPTLPQFPFAHPSLFSSFLCYPSSSCPNFHVHHPTAPFQTPPPFQMDWSNIINL